MNPVLPRLALHALARDTHPMLVAARRGQVLHAVAAGCCHPRCSLTPTGRLQRQLRPLCGQAAKSWHYQDQPTRPLCAYCTAIASSRLRDGDWRRLDVLDVLRAVAMASDPEGISAARRALISAGLVGDVALRQVVAARRHELVDPGPSARDVAWLHGQRPTPHPHPPVRHNFAA